MYRALEGFAHDGELDQLFDRAGVAYDKAAAEKALAKATKKLDKAVSKGVIHANQAANRKSTIAAKAAAL